MADDFTPLASVPEKEVDDGAPLPPWPESSLGLPPTPNSSRHRKNSSSLSDLSMLELDRTADDGTMEIVLHEMADTAGGGASTTIPVSALIVVTDSCQLEKPPPPPPIDPSSPIPTHNSVSATTDASLLETPHHNILQDMMHDWSDFGEFTLSEGEFRVKNWDGKKGYSDYIQQGLRYKAKQSEEKAKVEEAASSGNEAVDGAPTSTGPPVPVVPSTDNVVMLFESPSSCTADFTFQNITKFRFHDWPPPSKTGGKSVLGPCRYALMNGTSYPVFLKDGTPPTGLVDHWQSAVPGFLPPIYVDKITDAETVYAYLPVEQIRHHVNDPDIHYHLAGKDAIHLMTQKTTELLSDTKTVRPCVVKTTHSMGSKGIFIIYNDEDEREFENFLVESGHPTYVVTNFVDIARNVACHFFMHPNGSVVWFGSNENHREADGSFSSDSYLIMEHQDKLKELQLPFVQEVVQYCHGLGFFGFCGVDVLFDSKDRGYLVDINPRVTGSCPALMTLKRLADHYNFTVGLFRRSGKTCFHGPSHELLEQVTAYNTENEGKSRVVIHSMFQQPGTSFTRINIGVYGTNLNECKTVLNSFAKGTPKPLATVPEVAN